MKATGFFLSAAAALALASCAARPQEGTSTLHILSTGDVHGAWFDSTYVGTSTRPSLLAVKYYADSIRQACGSENVLLLDAGDCLQGDNAPYYFNFVETGGEHLYPRLASYLGYDAVIVGNHDIETGHPVYDKVAAQMRKLRIPFLAGNAICPNGKTYFDEYTVIRRGGMKVLVMGYTNPNMKAWLGEQIWKGMEFENLIPLVQNRVDAVRRKVKPDAVVVVVHSGSGYGDGSSLESQGLDLLSSLRGVDLIVTGHDHRPLVAVRDSICLVNGGSRASVLCHTVIDAEFRQGKIASKHLDAEIINIDKTKVSAESREKFRADYEKVKAFTKKPAGRLAEPIRTRDAFAGPSFYTNLIHKVQLEATGAQISFAAPISYNKFIKAGNLIYNDMFAIYPYENTVAVMKLYGREIADYLEYSYDAWIRPYDGIHALNIEPRSDPRTGSKGWSFAQHSYNFDSAAGINYTVDITRQYGSRVEISSLASGAPFDPDVLYTVALTSYRAAGGGDLIFKGANLTREESEARMVAFYPQIRDLICDFLSSKEKAVGAQDVKGIGEWKFVPAQEASRLISSDMELLFSKK